MGGIPRLVREIGPALTKELVMTCRRFTPDEAKSIGFVNRVVPPARLKDEVEKLAQQLTAMPSVPVAITKEHVNSVARAMSAGTTSFADGDVLLGSFGEEESRAAAAAYRAKTLGENLPTKSTPEGADRAYRVATSNWGNHAWRSVTLEWARQWPCEEVWKARKVE